MHVIWRAEKIKLKQTGNERRHHKNREHIKLRKNPEREEFNMCFEKDNLTLFEHSKRIMQKHKETTGKKAKETAVVLISHLMTVSPEAKEELLKNKEEWIKEQLNFCETTSPGEIVAWYYEEDEETPHLHIYQSAANEDGKLNINRDGIFAGAGKMQALQEIYEMQMRYSGIFKEIESRIKQEERTVKRKHQSSRIYKEIEERIRNEIKLKEAEKTIEEIFKE